MTASRLAADPVRRRVEQAALVGYGALWLSVAGLIAVVVRLQVPNPEELLRDVADRPVSWIGANVLLIAQQALLIFAAPALARFAGPGTVAASAITGLGAIAGGALVASGVFHGVLGAHLASHVGPGPIDPDLVRSAEVVHALGDTCWFVGVGALLVATAIGVAAVRATAPRWLTVIGAGSVAANLLQFGWFADHAFGVFAAPGTLLQAAWLAGVAPAARHVAGPPDRRR